MSPRLPGRRCCRSCGFLYWPRCSRFSKRCRGTLVHKSLTLWSLAVFWSVGWARLWRGAGGFIWGGGGAGGGGGGAPPPFGPFGVWIFFHFFGAVAPRGGGGAPQTPRNRWGAA